MPTPAIYSRIGNAATAYTFALLLGSVGLMGVATAVSLYLPVGNPAILLAVCTPFAVWCWGLLLAAFWFRENGVLRFARGSVLGSIVRWIAAVFLSIWFLSPVAIPFVFLQK